MIDIVRMSMCESSGSFTVDVEGSGGKVYECRFGPVGPGGPYSHGWSCTCPGFKFRGKCKHTDVAESKRCGWHEQFDGGSAVDGKCPVCNGKAVLVDCAV
jgi:hypothetical protein